MKYQTRGSRKFIHLIKLEVLFKEGALVKVSAKSCSWSRVVMIIEFIVSIIGLIAVWFMTASASDAVVVCLVVLIVIALIKKVRHDTNRKD